MSGWDIDRAKSVALASDWADAVVATMLRSTPLDTVNRKRWMAIAGKITGVLSPMFVFMGTLGLLHDAPREEFQLPSPDQTGDVATAFLSDPVELIQAAAAWLPSGIILGVGLSLYAFQAALISTPFTRSNVKTRLSGLRDNGTTLASVLEPFRVAVVGLGWRSSALWASTAAAFAVLAWLMSTSFSFIPGWATVVVIVWGHYAVSNFISSDNKRRIGGALTVVKSQLTGSLLNAFSANDKPEPTPPPGRVLPKPSDSRGVAAGTTDNRLAWWVGNDAQDARGMTAGMTRNPALSSLDPISTPSGTRSVAPLIGTQLVALDADLGGTKAEVIQSLARLVAKTGRADATPLVRDVMKREGKAATGLPGGFAIPHARSAAVTESALAFARLSRPVDFGAKDRPADLVFLIAVPEGGEEADYLKMLTKLARALVRKEFLRSLRAASSKDEIVALVGAALSPDSPMQIRGW